MEISNIVFVTIPFAVIGVCAIIFWVINLLARVDTLDTITNMSNRRIDYFGKELEAVHQKMRSLEDDVDGLEEFIAESTIEAVRKKYKKS